MSRGSEGSSWSRRRCFFFSPCRPPGYGAGVICSSEEDASASRTSLPSCCFLLTVLSLGFLLKHTTLRTPNCSRAPKHREAHERDSGGPLAAWGTTAALRRRGEVPWGGTGGRGPDSSRPSDSSCSMASTPVRPVPRAGRSTGGTSTMGSRPEPAYSLARASLSL